MNCSKTKQIPIKIIRTANKCERIIIKKNKFNKSGTICYQMIGIPAIKMNNSNEISALESIKIENISETESYPESKYI